MKLKIDDFFKKLARTGEAVSFGDVRMRTDYSEVLPSEVLLSSAFSRNVPLLNNVLISSPMDTVTEYKMAKAMALQGGLGIIHRGLTPKEQAAHVAKVKHYLNGFIRKPICVSPDDTIEQVLNRIEEKEYSFRSFPVVDTDGKLIGVLTNNDFDFCENQGLKVSRVMSKSLVTISDDAPIKEIYSLMQAKKKKILPVIDDAGILQGMYVYSDVKRIISGGSPAYNLDDNGNLRVGAAIGTGEDTLERVELLVAKGVDVVVIDTAHGDTKSVIDTLREVKRLYGSLDVVVGNVSEGASARRLADAGADGIKVGQGPGSICTTRMVAGIGCPQVTAIYECAKAVRGTGVPICADGGIKYSGDIVIALAAGAANVMLGGMLAGTDESPGEVITRNNMPVKVYRGMGSLGAMESSQASRERYGQGKTDVKKLVPEGVEGVTPYKGKVGDIVDQCLGGLRSGMGYVGAATISELHVKANFYRLTTAGLGESHASITITKEPPNYRQ